MRFERFWTEFIANEQKVRTNFFQSQIVQNALKIEFDYFLD